LAGQWNLFLDRLRRDLEFDDGRGHKLLGVNRIFFRRNQIGRNRWVSSR